MLMSIWVLLDILKCISCVAQIGYVLAQVAGHVCRLHIWVAYVTPECWFISVLVNFRRSICPFLAKVMPDFSVNSGMTSARICRKYRVPWICVLSILVVLFDQFSINVSTMNIGNVWRRKRFHWVRILWRPARLVRQKFPSWWQALQHQVGWDLRSGYSKSQRQVFFRN